MDQTREDALIDLRAAARGRGESLEAMYRGDAEDAESMTNCERLLAEREVGR